MTRQQRRKRTFRKQNRRFREFMHRSGLHNVLLEDFINGEWMEPLSKPWYYRNKSAPFLGSCNCYCCRGRVREHKHRKKEIAARVMSGREEI